MIFKQDPAAALDKTRAKLSSVEDNIAGLRAKRADMLTPNAGAVITIDKAIEAETAKHWPLNCSKTLKLPGHTRECPGHGANGTRLARAIFCFRS